jgi:hypothetical protein
VLLLCPLAVGMSLEKATGRNPYFLVGGTRNESIVRKNSVRATGPFRHPILAGTAGAVALPLAHYLLSVGRPALGVAGLLAGSTIVICSASSGPMAAAMIYPLSLFFRSRRKLMKRAIIAAGALVLIYPLISGRGPWYLMARIDLTGGSTGWHRAYLIDRSFTFLNEWWLFGTDRTRHWMPTGVSWNENHSDITNYFLHLGVQGGLPVALALAALIFGAFRRLIRSSGEDMDIDVRLDWALGASLAIHTLSFISISYFDQMYVVLYLLLAAIFATASPQGGRTDLTPSFDGSPHQPQPALTDRT